MADNGMGVEVGRLQQHRRRLGRDLGGGAAHDPAYSNRPAFAVGNDAIFGRKAPGHAVEGDDVFALAARRTTRPRPASRSRS